MFRRVLLVATLSASVAVFGQGKSGGAGGAAGSGSPATSAPPAINSPGVPTTQSAIGGLSGQQASGPITQPSANQTGAPTVPETVGGVEGNSGTTQENPGTVNNNGFPGGFIGSGSTGSPLATPTATFASPQPTAGISNMGRAGITAETPIETGVQNTVGPSTIVYTNMEPVNPAPVNANPIATGRLINDMGPSYFAGGTAVSGNMMAAASLGEVAAKFKSQSQGQNIRTYTNADVDRINSHMNLRGKNINANFAPSSAQDPGQQSASMAQPQPVQATPQASSSSPFSQRLSASARPSPAIRAEGNQASASQTDAPAQTDGAAQQGTSESPTTPQVRQSQASPDHARQSGNRLPATSTLLPLLGILGLASGGIGFIFRKFRS